MRKSGFVVGACLLSAPCCLLAQGVAVSKTNPMKIYVHLMPWFQTPETLGGTNWGWHWTMNDRNPNIIDSNGEREIASNDYPLIGPYDSSDPNVIEYQMLLMKLCGVDGVILDWYGTQGTNGDEKSLLSASNTIISKIPNYGLQFGVCLEDRFAASTSNVTANINYAAQNYFTNPAYIHIGSSNAPLMPLFGPITYTQPSSWTTIMSGVSTPPALLPLWYQSQEVGSPAKGEFSWIYQDAGTSDFLTLQQNFLNLRTPQLGLSMGVAFPGYNDYYAQGDAGAGAGFVIPTNNGQTLSSLLSLAAANSSKINALQLATWNDYGEGTMFEPTVQNGFSSLEELQQFTGVSYGLSQLQLVYQLYEARTELAGNSAAQATLNQTSSDINNLDFPDAHTSLAAALTSVPSNISNVNALTLNGTASLDLANHVMFVNYTAGADPQSAIFSYLALGSNNGQWNGNGIASSTVAGLNASQSALIYAVGYADGADGVVSGLSSGRIEIMPTLAGDAKLQGNVNFGDFQLLAANFGSSAGWDGGNFLYGSTVNFGDFQLLAQNFGATSAGLSSNELASINGFAGQFNEQLVANATGTGFELVSVPEPASTAMLAGSAGLLLARRRRTRRRAAGLSLE